MHCKTGPGPTGLLDLSDGYTRTTVPVTTMRDVPPAVLYQVRAFQFEKTSREVVFGVLAPDPIVEVGFELVGAGTFKAHGVPRPLTELALFMRDKRLSAKCASAEWHKLSLVERTVYSCQAEDSRRESNAALNLCFARHGVKRSRAECAVCCGPAEATAVPCPCGGVYCVGCFKKMYADNLTDTIKCPVCQAKLSMSAVDTFTRPGFAAAVYARAWVADALARDQAHIPAIQALLPQVHEALVWVSTLYDDMRVEFLHHEVPTFGEHCD